MKKLFIALLLLASTVFAEVNYTHVFDTYDEAKAQNKLVLIMLSNEGCPGCEYMENVVFEDKEVNKYMHKNYVIVKIDTYHESVPEELEYFGTPTFYFQDRDENILKRVNGGQKTAEFLQTLKSVASTKN